MSFITLIIIAVGLGMDAFSVAIAAGASASNLTFRSAFRLAFHFGIFQFMMPIIGWAAGLTLANMIDTYDHWVAFGLLGCVGGNMIRESFARGDESLVNDPTKGMSLVMLSVATSIDALAVGLSFALLKVRIYYASIVIGFVAFAMTMVGVFFGKKLGRLFGKEVGLLGGLILIAIGIKILFDHTH